MNKTPLLKLASLFLLLFACVGLKAQQSQIKEASAFPTKEIYDLHVDKRGFLWIASDLGVARFDGISYVHFSHPRQISLGCTNLLEDSNGRIWFNNFNGQIFYIDNEAVSLIDAYDYTKERNFPRMVLLRDQLLATSDKGLFVLDTKSLKARYVGGAYTSSLAVLKDRVLIRGDRTWYTYNGTGALKKIAYSGDEELRGNVYTLANNTYRDTAYLMANPLGVVNKLLLKNDTVRQCAQVKVNNFINTISVTPDDQWINTNDRSYSLKSGEEIKGHNLSAIVNDHEGNRWFSSLYYGLLVQYKKDIATKTTVLGLDTGDLVVSLKRYKDKLLLGTQKGYLILYDPASRNTYFKFKVSPAAGSINYLAAVGPDDYLAASSLATYHVNIPTKNVTEYINIKTTKQLCYDNKATYIASTSGLFIIPREKSELLNRQILDAYGHVFKYNATDNFFYLRLRARAIANFPEQDALFVTIKNILYKIDRNGMKPFLFDGQQVYAASLSYIDHRLYIGTISNGMLVVDQHDIKHISVQNGLFSKSIFKIKPIDKNLWILGSGPMQIFNTQKRDLVNDYAFPDRSASEVLDLDGMGQMVYLATSSGLDNFPLVKATADKKLKNYLLYVKVNNQISTSGNNRKLSYSENNVLFNIGIPAYLKARDIYIKYCLSTKTDSTWLTTEPGERSIHFSSLMPGSYTLKAIAVDPRMGVADSMINYSFTIQEPWWRGTAFKIALFFIFAMLLFYAYVIMLQKRLSMKKAFDKQQQLILAERQRISAEMHDDIGPGVFTIKTLAERAGKSENVGPEIDQIKNMVNELSAKIREVIWSTHVGNDNLENLIYYTYAQIDHLFEHSPMQLNLEWPEQIPDMKITVQSRRTIYLLVKEIVHNAIKHSQASIVTLKMFISGEALCVVVSDNGVGINANTLPVKGSGSGMGLGNIRARVEKLKGELIIENKDGACIDIKIPLNELCVAEFDKRLNKWQLFIARILKISSDH